MKVVSSLLFRGGFSWENCCVPSHPHLFNGHTENNKFSYKETQNPWAVWCRTCFSRPPVSLPFSVSSWACSPLPDFFRGFTDDSKSRDSLSSYSFFSHNNILTSLIICMESVEVLAATWHTKIDSQKDQIRFRKCWRRKRGDVICLLIMQENRQRNVSALHLLLSLSSNPFLSEYPNHFGI